MIKKNHWKLLLSVCELDAALQAICELFKPRGLSENVCSCLSHQRIEGMSIAKSGEGFSISLVLELLKDKMRRNR